MIAPRCIMVLRYHTITKVAVAHHYCTLGFTPLAFFFMSGLFTRSREVEVLTINCRILILKALYVEILPFMHTGVTHCLKHLRLKADSHMDISPSLAQSPAVQIRTVPIRKWYSASRVGYYCHHGQSGVTPKRIGTSGEVCKGT